MALRFAALLHLFFACTARSQYSTNEILVDPAKHDEEFFSFASRPDIEAPRWDSKVFNQSALSPGYWFVTPYETVTQTHVKNRYVAPAIYDPANGELVWNGGRDLGYFDTFSLQMVKYQNQRMLSFIEPEESQGVVMNNRYQPIRHVRVGTIGVTSNMHDFQIVDDGTKALYMTAIHKTISREQSRFFQYDGECMVSYAGIEERDLETDEITFSWSSEGRVAMEETFAHPVPEGFPQYNNTDLCGTKFGVDYIHGNSVEKLPDGDYLMSSRHMSALYKISHVDGSIVWRLGGKKSDFTFTEGTHFSAQHDARCLFSNKTHMTISIMDNAVGVWEDVGYHSNPNSRGLVMSLNLETMVATETAHYDHPGGEGSFAFERGNMQTLPNGNVFITWTNSAHHSEYTADGTLIAEAKFYTALKTYRSFKYVWPGRRHTKPDAHSEVVSVDGELQTVVSVSWNGDTLARGWSLYEVDADGNNENWLNSTKKTGFETKITYKGYVPYIRVDASDEDGTAVDDSLTDTIHTIFVPEAGANNPFPPQSDASKFDPPQSNPPTPAPPITSGYIPGDLLPLQDPVFVFLGGIFFGALLLLGIRKLRWPIALTRMRRKVTYTALRDDDEKISWLEEDGLLHESDDEFHKAS